MLLDWTGQIKEADGSKLIPENHFLENKPVVILIHGFTGKATNLSWLATQLMGAGFDVLLFEYDSLKGIDIATKELNASLGLDRPDELRRFRNRSVFLVAHSLGGLVARLFALDCSLRSFVRGVIMLGTPNDGAFTEPLTADVLHRVVSALTRYLQLAGVKTSLPINPDAIRSRTLTQILKRDVNATGSHLIDTINDRWKRDTSRPLAVSFAGRRNELDPPAILGLQGEDQMKRINSILQFLMNNRLNDGLVREDSVDLNSGKLATPMFKYEHRACPNANQINHQQIKDTAPIDQEVTRWLHNPL